MFLDFFKQLDGAQERHTTPVCAGFLSYKKSAVFYAFMSPAVFLCFPTYARSSVWCGAECGATARWRRAVGELTELGVKRAKEGRHVDGDGLMLVVRPSGKKSWLLRYQMNGVRRDMGLGSYPEIGLKEARQRTPMPGA